MLIYHERIQNWQNFSIFCLKLDTRVNIHIRKWRLLSVLNLTKYTIKENKEIKVKKNIKKITLFLALCSENWGSGEKMVFL